MILNECIFPVRRHLIPKIMSPSDYDVVAGIYSGKFDVCMYAKIVNSDRREHSFAMAFGAISNSGRVPRERPGSGDTRRGDE